MPIYGTAKIGGEQPNWVEPIDGRYATGVGVGVANMVFLTWFRVAKPVTVQRCTISVSVQSGNLDVGLYASDGTNLTRLGSSGSTACAAPGAQTITLGSTITLVPGIDYYAAIAPDNATASFGRISGVAVPASTNTKSMQKATSFPLPASLAISGLSSASVSYWLAWAP